MRGRFGGAFGGRHHGEERVREHREGDPPMPGFPLPDLMLVQAGEPFAGLERSSTRQRWPATLTSTLSGTGLGENPL